MGRDSRKRKRSPDAAQGKLSRSIDRIDSLINLEETSLRRSNRLRASNPHSTLHSPQPTRSVEPTESEGLDTATLVESQGSPYAMEMVLAPPRRIAVGETFGAPLVVTVSARRRRGRRASETQQISDLNGIWAFLSLITADGKESLAPPRHDLLKGNITDTIHPLSTVPQTDEDPFAYVTFPGLRINEPGRYRFKVNLIDTTR